MKTAQLVMQTALIRREKQKYIDEGYNKAIEDVLAILSDEEIKNKVSNLKHNN